MRTWRARFASEEDPRCGDLDQRLRVFYSSSQDYQSFETDSWEPEFWGPIRAAIEDAAAAYGTCRVLEVGAGRTGFTTYLGEELRRRIQFDVQDVTARNADHLRMVADRIYICDITEVRESYDVILGTFVYEHITRPKAALEHLLYIMKPGGSLFLASPRYDFPFYLSPSARHLSKVQQLTINAELMVRRLRVLLGGAPLFLIHMDPAVFHTPWYRDADAVHWPSVWDLRRFLGDKVAIERLRIRTHGLRQWFWARFLLLFVRIKTDRVGGERVAPAHDAAPAGRPPAQIGGKAAQRTLPGTGCAFFML